MKIDYVFTAPGEDPFDIPVKRVCLSSPSGPIEEIEVPESWSQNAAEILASRYARQAGVPDTGHETSFKEIFHRLLITWRNRGYKYGHFKTEKEADIFYQEMAYLLVHQIASPNSPQYFNVGLWDEYGIKGSNDGHWHIDLEAGEAKLSDGAYVYPQSSACFILELEDSLFGEQGIIDLIETEAKIFRFGSGSGVNVSNLRSKGERISSGGTSSGLMSFMKVIDASAGAIKSGGTTRRAATDRSIDLDHPEALDFIRWKSKEENKAKVLIEAGYDGSMDGEAYQTVAGQNCNLNVCVPNELMQKSFSGDEDGVWEFKSVLDRETVSSIKASELLEEIAAAAHHAADPGIKFIDTINSWNPCPNDGKIKSSNPCNEYLFLTNTCCNLGSVRLTAFYDQETKELDVDKLVHTFRLMTIMLDITVSMGGYPTKKMAEGAYKYRTIGLGAADLGGLLMQMGISYDSIQGRAWGQAISALMTGTAYETSAMLAKKFGAFPRFEANKEPALNKINRMAKLIKGNTNTPLLSCDNIPDSLKKAVLNAWTNTTFLSKKYGYRNAEVTAWAPTGTIGLLMDCTTTSLEPDFSPVKLKRLAGGGYMRIINNSLEAGLRALGYNKSEVKDIISSVIGHQSFENAPHVDLELLRSLGAEPKDIARVEELASTAFNVSDIITKENLPSLSKIFSGSGSILKSLLSKEKIDELNRYVCGSGSIELAPHIKEEHLSVFDCAVPSIPNGRFLSAESHVKMLASCQTFTSMGISKTVNLPNDATVEDIIYLYRLAWMLGVKCISVYRDGSKYGQPLSTAASKEEDVKPIVKEEAENKDAFLEIDLTDIEFLESGLKCNAGSCSI